MGLKHIQLQIEHKLFQVFQVEKLLAYLLRIKQEDLQDVQLPRHSHQLQQLIQQLQWVLILGRLIMNAIVQVQHQVVLMLTCL